MGAPRAPRSSANARGIRSGRSLAMAPGTPTSEPASSPARPCVSDRDPGRVVGPSPCASNACEQPGQHVAGAGCGERAACRWGSRSRGHRPQPPRSGRPSTPPPRPSAGPEPRAASMRRDSDSATAWPVSRCISAQVRRQHARRGREPQRGHEHVVGGRAPTAHRHPARAVSRVRVASSRASATACWWRDSPQPSTTASAAPHSRAARPQPSW